MPYWTIPFIITLVVFWRAFSVDPRGGGGYGIGKAIGGLFALAAAAVVSLIAWLIYFIIV